MKLNILYFARLRERFGRDAEVLQLAEDNATVSSLLAHLAARGDIWADELGGGRVFRVALDQELVEFDKPLHDGAELAIFPPVTGG